MRQGGINYDSFDETFPISEWSRRATFATKAEIEYNLMVRTGLRTPNPPACVVTVWMESGAGFHWEVQSEGSLWDQNDAYERFRAAMEYVPKAEPNPYLINPLFGRF